MAFQWSNETGAAASSTGHEDATEYLIGDRGCDPDSGGMGRPPEGKLGGGGGVGSSQKE
jgi:hypothetical protein